MSKPPRFIGRNGREISVSKQNVLNLLAAWVVAHPFVAGPNSPRRRVGKKWGQELLPPIKMGRGRTRK